LRACRIPQFQLAKLFRSAKRKRRSVYKIARSRLLWIVILIRSLEQRARLMNFACLKGRYGALSKKQKGCIKNLDSVALHLDNPDGWDTLSLRNTFHSDCIRSNKNYGRPVIAHRWRISVTAAAN
jgi:hypothetical protein